ncbi:MAG: DUF4097 family beta strand repeat protein [Flavobacteriaceae bacterium]|nr:DUF4097 family beta strand repeat protein [Flavobacteriaceae bacterium]
MLNKIGCIVCLFLVFSEIQAQKIMEKSWNSNQFERIEIISDEIYHVKIISEATETIYVNTKVEGEHSENIVLLISEANKTLSLTHGFTPYLVMQNDKLAAHKVISIEMEIRVPPHFKVIINGAITSVETEGAFNNIQLDLGSGNCVLKNFKGNAQLNSKDGNILVFAEKTVFGEAKSRAGSVKNELPKEGQFFIKAESVNGDITLLKSQN